VESEDGELPPPLRRLHPPPPRHLSKIRSQREFPPPVPSRPPGRHSKPASFASMPPAICCWHGWHPNSPHAQVGSPPVEHCARTQDPMQECVCIEKLKLTQADESELEQTHPGADNPFP
jgi:hypothetical protein